jgi:hypothetical protein
VCEITSPIYKTNNTLLGENRKAGTFLKINKNEIFLKQLLRIFIRLVYSTHSKNDLEFRCVLALHKLKENLF